MPSFPTPNLSEAGVPDPEVDLWRDAIDEMLRWMSQRAESGPDEMPWPDMLATAIDYAVGQAIDTNGANAPTSIVPSGRGRIAMEWNGGPITLIVEFTGRGEADFVEMHSGKLHERRPKFDEPAFGTPQVNERFK